MKDYDVPLGWVECVFGDIAKIRNGYAFKSSLFKKQKELDSDVPLIKQTQLVGNSVDLSSAAYLPKELLSKHSEYILNKGDILIGMSGSIGKICHYQHEFPALQNQRTGKIEFLAKQELNPRFLGLYLSNVEYELLKRAKGMGVQNISAKDIQSMSLFLPPINEQHRIVTKIETLFAELDKGIESLKTAREQLKVYRQAVLKHAFEGKLTAKWREENKDKLESPEQLLARIQQERQARYQQQLQDWQTAIKAWEKNGKEGKKPGKPRAIKELLPFSSEEINELPSLPKSWEWVKIDRISAHDQNAIKAGPFGSALKKEFYTKTGYKIYGQEQVISGDPYIGNYYIDQEKYNDLVSCRVRPNDILISLVGTVGKVLILPSDSEAGIINPRLIKISLNTGFFEPGFFKFYFESAFVRGLYKTKTHGATMDVMNLSIIQELPFPLFSIGEQSEIVAILESIDSEIDNLDRQMLQEMRRSETLRQSILKKAFSGQLVQQDPNDEPTNKLLARIKAEKSEKKQTSKPNKPRKKRRAK